jgi:hypothetical protein
MIESTKDTIGMSMHFGDADPVVVCLVLECKQHFHGDSVNDAIGNWSKHVSKDHREHWDSEPLRYSSRSLRIDRLEFGNQQFGHGGTHKGRGTLECPAWSHHHCDPFCEMPTLDELIMAGLSPLTFKPKSRS